MQTIPSSSPVLEYAGFLVRLVAYLIDLLILMAISCVLYIPVVIVFFISIATTSPSSDTASSIWVVILLILLFVTVLVEIILVAVYFAWFESSKFMGTPGKRIMKLKVTDASGNRITFITALLRYIVKTVINQIVGIGSLFILFNDKKQGIYDLLLNTYVIRAD